MRTFQSKGGTMQFSSVLSDNISHLHSLLDVGTNFDVVYRTARVGGRDACLYFVDGFTKDEVLLKILQAWSSIKPEAMPSDVHEFSKQYVPYGEVDLLDTEDSVITLLLSGITCVFIDGYAAPIRPEVYQNQKKTRSCGVPETAS